MLKYQRIVVSTNRTRKFGKGRHSCKQEGANAGAKIQERSGPLLVNEWSQDTILNWSMEHPNCFVEEI